MGMIHSHHAGRDFKETFDIDPLDSCYRRNMEMEYRIAIYKYGHKVQGR